MLGHSSWGGSSSSQSVPSGWLAGMFGQASVGGSSSSQSVPGGWLPGMFGQASVGGSSPSQSVPRSCLPGTPGHASPCSPHGPSLPLPESPWPLESLPLPSSQSPPSPSLPPPPSQEPGSPEFSQSLSGVQLSVSLGLLEGWHFSSLPPPGSVSAHSDGSVCFPGLSGQTSSLTSL